MGEIVFVTGGVRSGKSRFAEGLLDGEERVLYLATGIAFDDEMKSRIASHRSRRNAAWETVEGYRDTAGLVRGRLAGRDHVLLDCVTLLVSNQMLFPDGRDWDRAGAAEVAAFQDSVIADIAALLDLAGMVRGRMVLVSNELGMGIVPPTPLGRHFRDVAGNVNQYIASRADLVYLMVAGIPLKIKGA